MAVHLNRVLPNAHFRKRKTWAKLAKTWFNQPAKKVARRQARAAKAVAVAPRPLAGALRPVVQCPTFRYNAKARVGRGFTYDEVKGAGMNAVEAVQLGICIDKRRKNKSAENLQRNVQRLKEYRQKLVVLKKGAATDVEQNIARKVMPVTNAVGKVESAKITADMQKGSVYQAFHMARANVKYAGQREKRRLKRLAEEEEKKSRKK
jgi:large subunit ribosomal protein L13e